AVNAARACASSACAVSFAARAASTCAFEMSPLPPRSSARAKSSRALFAFASARAIAARAWATAADDVPAISREARGDRYDIGSDLRVVGRLFSRSDQRINSVEDQQRHDRDRDDEVDPLRAFRLDGRLVLSDFRNLRYRRGLHLHLHVYFDFF